MSDVSVARDATRHEDTRERRTATTRVRPVPREPMPTFEPDAGAVLHAANVETPRRDSMRRRALAAADVLALLGAYGVLWVVAPPPNSVTHDLVLLVAAPLWVVLNKSLRLYDRDANLVHQSTLNELPKIFHSLSLGAALAFLVGPLVPGSSTPNLLPMRPPEPKRPPGPEGVAPARGLALQLSVIRTVR